MVMVHWSILLCWEDVRGRCSRSGVRIHLRRRVEGSPRCTIVRGIHGEKKSVKVLGPLVRIDDECAFLVAVVTIAFGGKSFGSIDDRGGGLADIVALSNAGERFRPR